MLRLVLVLSLPPSLNLRVPPPFCFGRFLLLSLSLSPQPSQPTTVVESVVRRHPVAKFFSSLFFRRLRVFRVGCLACVRLKPEAPSVAATRSLRLVHDEVKRRRPTRCDGLKEDPSRRRGKEKKGRSHSRHSREGGQENRNETRSGFVRSHRAPPAEKPGPASRVSSVSVQFSQLQFCEWDDDDGATRSVRRERILSELDGGGGAAIVSSQCC